MNSKNAKLPYNYRFDGLIELRLLMQKAIDPKDLVASCVTCNHFDTDNELCKLANMRPPARIIAFGCESYSDISDIPF